jgi:hypothetical protein
MVRHMALNMLRHEPSVSKGIKTKRMKAGRSEQYLLWVLHSFDLDAQALGVYLLYSQVHGSNVIASRRTKYKPLGVPTQTPLCVGTKERASRNSR